MQQNKSAKLLHKDISVFLLSFYQTLKFFESCSWNLSILSERLASLIFIKNNKNQHCWKIILRKYLKYIFYIEAQRSCFCSSTFIATLYLN